jgi:hypothetical protein
MVHQPRGLRLTFFLLLLGLAFPAGAKESETTAPARDLAREEKEALKVISSRRARQHVVYLAGMKCEGRASGEKGCDVAAAYLAKCFEEMGVEAGGEGGGYLQVFTVRAGPFPGQGRRTGRESKPGKTSNVIGFLRGSDPERAREAIVLGGHYDHLGYRDLRKRKVYWGACDNAAGTAAVMLVAEAFARAEHRPARSLVFLLFSGEERGLLGSKHYVGKPTWPIGDTVAMINIDMLGRNEPHGLDVYGKGTGPEMDALNERHARASKLRLDFKGGSVFSRSDHFPFYEARVPVLFFTCGLYNDYHDLDDDARGIHYGHVERVAEHCWRILRDLAELPERPSFEELTPTGAAGVLGFVPVVLSRSQLEEHRLGKKRGAVAVGEVRAGKAAADAGIQPDDLVLGLAGKLLTNEDPLGELDEIADEMKQKRSGRKVAILVLREGKPEKIGIVIP